MKIRSPLLFVVAVEQFVAKYPAPHKGSIALFDHFATKEGPAVDRHFRSDRAADRAGRKASDIAWSASRLLRRQAGRHD